jgi:pimeloyl-ACP methyl ester carboxylesterase
VGVDLGGAIAMHLACTRPERVERLVLVNPIAFEDVPAGDVKAMQRNTARFAVKISRGVLGAAPLMRELLERSVADQAHMPDQLVARYLAPYVGKQGLEHLLALGRAIDEDDFEDVDLRQTDCPSLIVWGDQDTFVSPRLADHLADTLPGSRLVHLPRVARLVPEEAPDTLASMILEFIGAAAMARAE